MAPKAYAGPEPSAERLRLARQFVDLYGSSAGADDYADLYPELEPVRRRRVQQWVREIFPPDPERELAQSALFLARLLSEADLKTAVATGSILRDPPGEAEMDKATSDFGDARNEALAARLKALYCAEYDCGAAPASTRN